MLFIIYYYIANFIKVIESHKVDLSKPNIASCTAGMTSCTLAFVAHLLNNSTVPVYYVSIDGFEGYFNHLF